jgi:hypothetical protein
MALTSALSAIASKVAGAISSTQGYTPVAENWYKSFPYAFLATDAAGKSRIFYLPLNPSNISISTHFATNLISTIGGTVEEHAPQRYFDINISGTTGIAPQYTQEVDGKTAGAFSKLKALAGQQDSPPGRLAYTPEFTISGATKGFFAQTAGKLDNALNVARDLLQGQRKHESGFSAVNSGYMAFHNFYRFLLESKSSLASGAANNNSNLQNKVPFATLNNALAAATSVFGDKAGPLKFIIYKDNQEYTCAILRFELTRSADSPMLYNYSIVLRAYSLSSIEGGIPENINKDRLVALGLGEGDSVFSKIKGVANTAKRGISAVGGLGRSLGR